MDVNKISHTSWIVSIVWCLRRSTDGKHFMEVEG